MEGFIFTCFDERGGFKKIHAAGGMLLTGGNPAAGTKILMNQCFALIFYFNCVCLSKYLCSNIKKKCYNTFKKCNINRVTLMTK